jgi:hypothetical protein
MVLYCVSMCKYCDNLVLAWSDWNSGLEPRDLVACLFVENKGKLHRKNKTGLQNKQVILVFIGCNKGGAKIYIILNLCRTSTKLIQKNAKVSRQLFQWELPIKTELGTPSELATL